MVLLLVTLFVTAGALCAQHRKIQNQPYYDQRRLHWGFCLGLNLPDITFSHSGAENGEGWWATVPNASPSFLVGLMGDLAITEHLNLRVSPTIYFQERQVAFERTVTVDAERTRQHNDQSLRTTYLEIPVSLKVSSRRINNYRPYLVGGASVSMDMSHESETPIVFERMDMGVHIGIGCDIYLPYFKLAPELRFHLGLCDMIDHQREGLKDETMMPYTNALKSARNTGLSLIFWFE